MKKAILLCLLTYSISFSFAQEDLLKSLDSIAPEKPATEYTQATFKGTRIINGHSIQTSPKGTLLFLISHRFGRINSGIGEFFGLDQATIRLGLDYGITDNFTIGIGRSREEKTYDSFLKWRLLRQSTGERKMPFTATLYANLSITGQKYENPEIQDNFNARLAFVYQLILARKFSERFSLQLSPTYLHRNLSDVTLEEDDVFALGMVGRVKLTKRIALSAEYYWVLSKQTSQNFTNSLAIGFDIETGGHVFQLHFTNSFGMIEKFFIPRNTEEWTKGDIHFGFNIARNFQLGGRKKAPPPTE
jgi:hypothetical protein